LDAKQIIYEHIKNLFPHTYVARIDQSEDFNASYPIILITYPNLEPTDTKDNAICDNELTYVNVMCRDYDSGLQASKVIRSSLITTTFIQPIRNIEFETRQELWDDEIESHLFVNQFNIYSNADN